MKEYETSDKATPDINVETSHLNLEDVFDICQDSDADDKSIFDVYPYTDVHNLALNTCFNADSHPSGMDLDTKDNLEESINTFNLFTI